MPSLIAALLLVGLAGAVRLPTTETRAGIIAGYRMVLSANDRDGDGRVSRAEWTAMVSGVLPEQPLPDPHLADYTETRASLLAQFDEQDLNHDGYLTLRELVREPLAFFACADRNRDGRLSEREIWRAMSRCPSHETRIDLGSPPPSGATAH